MSHSWRHTHTDQYKDDHDEHIWYSWRCDNCGGDKHILFPNIPAPDVEMSVRRPDGNVDHLSCEEYFIWKVQVD